VNVWILCNEDAGRGLSADDLQVLVERGGHTVAGVAKQYDENSTLPKEHLDVVVAAGGDGTVATAAGIAAETSAALAILPLGTANNIATSLGLQTRVPDLIASWSNASRVPFDLGFAHAGSRKWLIVEGIGGGLVPAGIGRVEAAHQRQKPATPSDEVAAAMRAFHRTLVDLAPQAWTISIDGTQMCDEFLLVEVLNIRSVGPNLVFAPDASPSDGYFDVVTAQETHRKELETYFEHRLNGRDTRLALPQHRARRVSIASCTEMHIDDERVDTCALGPVSVEIAPAAITVLL
jgi:diacylglycerol kinase family enzyme